MSMAWVAVSMAVVGTSVSAYGQYEQGQSSKAAANYNNQINDIKARSAENTGAQAAADKKMQARKVAASGVAAAGAGGVDPTTGTPLTLETQTAQFGELDSLRIINNASRQAWGFDVQQETPDATRSNLNAGASLLSGASSAYFGGANAGMWGPKANPVVVP